MGLLNDMICWPTTISKCTAHALNPATSEATILTVNVWGIDEGLLGLLPVNFNEDGSK
jgi:hypothetical protein